MRSSFVPLAAAAGALLALAALDAAPAEAAAGCCSLIELSRTEVFERAEPEGGPAPEPAPDAAPAPTPLDPSTERLAVGDVYGDVFEVLKDDNTCSRFFGGPRVAVTVFNEFARRLQSRRLGAGGVALVMSGDYTKYRDGRTGASYRLFDEATINSDGPFASLFTPPAGRRVQIGRFPAETRQAKALMLLHELGHLIQEPGGPWLLPNDGGDRALSEHNTRTVELHCLGQLLALRD